MIRKEIADEVVFSWQVLAGREFELVSNMYIDLFKKHPELKPLFPDDMNGLAQKLEATLKVAIDHAYSLEDMIDDLHELGRYHKHRVGVEPFHYPIIIKSLLRAIKKTMGDEYNEKVGRAWQLFMIYMGRHMASPPPKKGFFSKLKGVLNIK